MPSQRVSRRPSGVHLSLLWLILLSLYLSLLAHHVHFVFALSVCQSAKNDHDDGHTLISKLHMAIPTSSLGSWSLNSSIFASMSWTTLSAWLMASILSFLFLSSSAYFSASWTMFSISSLDRPPPDWITTVTVNQDYEDAMFSLWNY